MTARCLRCGAGNEWIEGKAAPAPSAPAQEPVRYTMWSTSDGYVNPRADPEGAWVLYAAPQPDEAVALLRALEPHLDKLICYASTTDEYEPNAIVARIRAFLKDRT